MPYERAGDIVRLAILLQGSWGGLTLRAIQDEFSVSRRTAERMRSAVETVFGPVEAVDTGERLVHWRLHSPVVPPIVRVSLAEMVELDFTSEGLERAGLTERAATIRTLAAKLRAIWRPRSPPQSESDLETPMRAEGLAMRAGPRPRIEAGLLSRLRDAIRAARVVEFDYLSRSTGRRRRHRVRPYGVLYENRAFLVGPTEQADDVRLWRLANMSAARITGATFERDPAFDPERYAKRSFGTSQEEPVEVVLRFDANAAPDASAFLFHPGQRVAWNEDGTLTVRFEAGGIDEMCWHLFTWGKSVTVERPARLRRRLAGMCESLAAHHHG